MINESVGRMGAITRLISVGILSTFVVTGCASTSISPRGCESNFSTQGSFLSGKRFSTSEVINGISEKDAYASLYKILAGDGYYIQSSNERLGVISAFQNVNLSDKKAPLNALVKGAGQDVEVSLTFVASGGVYTPEVGARNEFCRIISRVKN
jgi:hypothetical protein